MDRIRSNANVNRLLHVLVPFLIMIALEKGVYFEAIRFFPDAGDTVDLVSFLLGAAAAVLFFRLYDGGEVAESDDGAEPVGPIKTEPVVFCALRLVIALAALAGWMYAVNLLADGAGFSEELRAGGWAFGALRIFSLILLHPVAEEWIFRRMFYGELRLMNPIFGVLAQAVMFAIAHRSTETMIYALGAGLILGILRERTGRLWCVIAAHSLTNLRSLLCLTLHTEKSQRLAADAVLLTLALLACAALIVVRVRSRRTAKASEPTREEGTTS